MDKLSAMQVFARVIAEGSFAAAGRALGLSRSAVSKQVGELEAHLGARLLDRTTRKTSPTEAGRAYYERCADILAQVAETEAQISALHDQPRGLLRVNAPTSFGILHLSDAMAEFMAQYQDIEVQLSLTDSFVDPVEEGVDLTIRIADLQDSSFIARKLAPARIALVAAPEYLVEHGIPKHPLDLIQHRCLVYGHVPHWGQWELLQDGDKHDVRVPVALSSNNGEILRAAALAGQGIAMLPTFLMGCDLQSGRLVRVLPRHHFRERGIYALYAPNRFLAAKTRLFIDHLTQRFGPHPSWDAAPV